MKNNTKIDVFNTHIHYYIDEMYLGMLVFGKGELSDFRAIVRKNRMDIGKENLFKIMKVSLFELLNHFLVERMLINKEDMQNLKTDIVKKNEKYLKDVEKEILDKGII